MSTTTQTLWAPSAATRSAVSELPRQYALPVFTMAARPGARPVRAVGHETAGGFCSVCGAVWPCARARRDQAVAEQA